MWTEKEIEKSLKSTLFIIIINNNIWINIFLFSRQKIFRAICTQNLKQNAAYIGAVSI